MGGEHSLHHPDLSKGANSQWRPGRWERAAQDQLHLQEVRVRARVAKEQTSSGQGSVEDGHENTHGEAGPQAEA